MSKLSFFILLAYLLYIGGKTLGLKEPWRVFIPYWGLGWYLGYYAGRTDQTRRILARVGGGFALIYLLISTYALWSLFILTNNPDDYFNVFFFLAKYPFIILPIFIGFFILSLTLFLSGAYRFMKLFKGPSTKELAVLFPITVLLDLVLHYLSIRLGFILPSLVLIIYWVTREKEGNYFILYEDK
ncbi:hypothetical protein [Streptococcus himalayensis]|uniref:Uncharacterized protein n=1 Tax=Streptococcus himalayensis TaxID=1888195 RepID=A0A917A525_9STRE|nr:hypothetical protein [Streptococcus himalayensis]GGE28062.1 hypothetical protein GCM10011510_06520 [Streptococcus himalayensis]